MIMRLMRPVGAVESNVTLLSPATEPTNENTPPGNISPPSFHSEIRFRNRLSVGDTDISWSIL